MNVRVLEFLLMYGTSRKQFCHDQFVYQFPLKIPAKVISMHPLTRILSQHLEFLVLELKEITEIERDRESVYKLGPTLSSRIRYVKTVILHVKLKSRLPPRTSITGLLKLRLPWDNHRLTTTHESEMCPLVIGDCATKYEVSEPTEPKRFRNLMLGCTIPILLSGVENVFLLLSGVESVFSFILHDFAGVKLVLTHKRTLFRITSGTRIASDVVSAQRAQVANGHCKLVKCRNKLITISVPRRD